MALHQCLKPQIRVNVCCTDTNAQENGNIGEQAIEEKDDEYIRRADSLCRIFASSHVPGSLKKAKNKSMR